MSQIGVLLKQGGNRAFCALLVLGALFVPARAEAQYNLRFGTITGGAITFTGNALGLDGDDDDNEPGTNGSIRTFITTNTGLQDGSFPPGTTSDWRLNRSEAKLNLPAGARVLHAELVWGGTFATDDDDDNVFPFLGDDVAFTTPDGVLHDVTPDSLTGKSTGGVNSDGHCTSSNGCFYVRSADVTALVRAGGAGFYATGHVPGTQEEDNDNSHVAGWTLAVAYEDFTQPIRSLSLFQGMEQSGGAAASVAGFCTPPSGPLSGRLAVSAMEGDARIDGDKMLFGRSSSLDNDDRVDGPRNPRDNFFAGQITRDNGSLDTSGTFGDRNHDPGHPRDGARQGWDITNVDVSARLRNDQTQAFAQGKTDGDNYRIMALGLQINVGAPNWDNALSKAVDKAIAVIGDVLTYTVRIDNTSNVTSADNVVFFDDPPAGTSLVPGSVTINGVAQPGADPVAGVPLGTLTGGNAKVITFQVRVDSIPAVPDPQIRSNKARWTFDFVSCAGQPPLAGTTESNTVVTEVPVADLSITKTFPPLVPMIAGAPAGYLVIVANAGPSAVNGAIVTDAGTTPALTGMTWACLPNAGASSCVPSSGSGALSSSVNLPAGGGATFAVVGILPANTPAGTISNSASIGSPVGVPDPNLGNNIASASAAIATFADIRLTKSGPPTASPGSNITYTLVVTNHGPSDADGVVVSDPTPAGLTLVTPLSGTCGSSPGCHLAAGDSQTMTATFGVPPGYAGADPIVNTAGVSSATADPVASNNSAVAATALTAPVADLSITKTNGTTSVAAGSTTTYTITVTNLGPATALGTLVDDTFNPAVFTNVQWTCVPSGTSTCGPSGPQTGDIHATIGIDTGAANAVVFTATATVLGTATGSAANTVSVAAAAGVSDPDSSNNSATDTDTIISSADVSITNVGPAQIVPGTTVSYTVTVTNAGPSTVTNQPGTFQIFDAAGGDQPDWILPVTPPPGVTCERVIYAGAGGDILLPVCTVATLAPSASVVITVQVAVPAAYAPPLPATVSARAFVEPTSVPDPVTSNNEAVVNSQLLPQADVSVTKTGQTSILEGNSRSYFLHVANNGPSNATNVVINDPTPTGLTFVAIDGGAICSGFPCIVPVAAPGTNTDIRVDVLVPMDFPASSFVNTATITSDTADPDTSNNTSSVTTTVVPVSSDLALTKTGPGSASAGGSIAYDIVFRSLGVSDAINATMTDVLPAGTTFSAITTPPDTTCQTPAIGVTGTVTCVSTGVLPLVDMAFHLTVQVDATLAVGTVLTNVAVISSDVPDVNTANDHAVVNTAIAAPTDADVSIANLDSPDPVVVGSDVTYTLTVRNIGPASANGVSVTDTLPAGLNLVSATPSVGSCAGATCTLGTLAPGSSATITVIATATTSGVFTTSATVAATEHDPAPADNTATQPTTAGTTSEADLVIEKGGPTVLETGQVSGYVLRVTNRGPGPADNVQLLDTLPPEVELISVVGVCAGAEGLPCDLETIPPGESRLVTAAFSVPSGLATPAQATNTATVTTATTDVDLSNNTSTVVTDIYANPSADLEVVKIDSTDPVTAGTGFNYVLLVTNRGPEEATDVEVSDVLPTGVTLVTAATAQGSCSGTTTVTCTLGTLAPGSHAVIVLAIEAPTSVPTPNPMVNTATVSGSSPDPVPANDTATASTTVNGPVADLAITKTPGASSVNAGSALTWTIVVANAGPSHIVGAAVTDTFPADFTGATWTCVATPGSACVASGSGSLSTLVNLVVGGSAAFTVTGTVAPSALGPLSNTASVLPPAGATDPNLANNSATSAAVTITTSANVGITKTGPASVFAGSVLTYTLTVTNAGPSSATGISVADPTPAGLTFVATLGDCTTAFPCVLGAMSPGDTRTITARYLVPAGTPGPITNTAVVSSAVTDPVPANNSSTLVTTVVAGQTDLALTKTGSSSAAPGGALEYDIVITNKGAANATAVVMTDLLPISATFSAITLPIGTTCSTPAVGVTGIIRCQTPLLAPLAQLAFHVTAQAAPTLQPTSVITNVAVVSSSIPDFNTANDRAQANTMIAAATDADLVITNTDSPDPVVVGGNVTYTITVRNLGPASATGVSVSDALPAGLTLVSATPSQGGPCAGTTCPIGTLAPGATATITVVATATTAGVLSTTATATLTEHDPVTANNTATQPTTAAASASDADLLVEKLGPQVLEPGQSSAYLIRVTNRGPGTAVGVQVQDPLPVQVVFVSNNGACTTSFPCLLGDLSPGETRTIGTAIDVPIDLTTPATATNTATAAGSTTDPDPSNNTSSVVTDFYASPSADLEITKIDSIDPIVAGTSLSYAVLVTNRGPEAATSVQVSDVLPTGVTLISATTPQGSCTGTTTITCSLGTLAPGTNAVILVAVDGPTSTPTPNPMINTATVTSGVTDPVAGNDTGTASTTVAGAIADLAITKTPTAAAVTAGTPLGFTVVVTNAGPSQVVGAVVTDTFPVDFTGATWTCVPTSGSVCATSGSGSIATPVDLLAGGSAAFTVTGTVAPAALGTLSNTASVAAPAGATDTNPANNSATSAVTITTSADVGIVKTGAASAFTGTVLTYTLTVTNAGPSSATGVSVADPAPAGLVLLTTTGDCTTPFPCSLGTVAPGDTRTITARYDVTPAAAGPIANTATVSSGSPDPVAANNTSSVNTIVAAAQSDLVLTKTGPSSVARGGLLRYQLVVHNAGPASMVDVDTTDAVPGGMTFVSVAPPALTTCTTPAVGAAGIVSCRTPLVTPGSDVVIDLVTQANVDLALGTVLSNTAVVSSPVADIDTANNRAQLRTVIAADTDADLIVTVTDSPDPVVVGSNVTYTLTVVNQGPADASNVSVTGTLPAGLTLVSATPTQGSCASVACSLGTLTAGSTATVGIVATATTAGVFTASATATATEHDPLTANNAATQQTTAGTAIQADLLVEMIGPGNLAPGQTAVYQTRVTNRGPAGAAAAALGIALPAAFVFGTNTGDCTTAFPCALGTLAAGETRTILTTFSVNPGASVPAAVSSTATATSATSDPNAANNSAAVSTDLSAAGSADVQVTKTGSPVLVVAGTALTYTIGVTNQGPATATAVTITDNIPSGVNVLSAATTQGTCTGATSISCSLGDMTPGSYAIIEVVAESPAVTPTPNPMTNTATASSTSTDPAPANNIGVALTSVGFVVADLAVTKTPSAPNVDAAGSFSWTIVVTNNGPSDAIGASVADTIPAAFTSATWTCTATPGSLCAQSSGASSIATTVDLVVDGVATFVLTGTADASAVGPVANTVTVAPPAGTFDVDTANNSAASTVTVDPVVDLLLTKTGPARIPAGGTIVYTLTIGNGGPSSADSVVVADPTPAGLTFVANNGDCATAFPCSLGAMPAGTTRSITSTYTVPAGPSAPDSVVNLATVSSAGLAREINPSNDTGSAVTVVTRGTRCDLDGDGIDEIITGAGPGGGPHVRVFRRSGSTLTELASFWAYEPEFIGGAFVACGDVTGDGLAEIVTGAGPSAGPHVRAFSLNGSTLLERASFWAYDPFFRGGVHVAVGDITGDGIAEIITGAGPSAGPHVRAFSLDGSAISEVASFWAYDTFFRGGVYVAAGDLTGDGIAEIITGAGPGGGPHVRVLNASGTAVTELASFWAYDPAFPGGVAVASGDVDGDGIAEILTGAGPGGGPHVRVLSVSGATMTERASFYAYNPAFIGGVFVGTADVDGDGSAEIVTGAGPSGGPHVRVLTASGATVTELASFFAYDPAFRGGVHVASLDRSGDVPPGADGVPSEFLGTPTRTADALPKHRGWMAASMTRLAALRFVPARVRDRFAASVGRPPPGLARGLPRHAKARILGARVPAARS